MESHILQRERCGPGVYESGRPDLNEVIRAQGLAYRIGDVCNLFQVWGLQPPKPYRPYLDPGRPTLFGEVPSDYVS